MHSFAPVKEFFGLAILYRSLGAFVRPLCIALTEVARPVVVVVTILGAVPVLAETAADLGFRGQGPNNICFSFAEEQMLKDAVCKQNCATNASEWTVSIFDLIKLHMNEDIRVSPDRPEKNRLKYTLENGSRFVFPYHEVKSLRASKCTLERELFQFNRHLQTNPRAIGMRDQLIEFFEDPLAGVALSKSVPALRGLSEVLMSVARESKNANDFFNKALAYTTCSDRVVIPNLQVGRDLSRDEKQIRSTIVTKLREGRSIFAAVCGNTLRDEVVGIKTCLGHAVVFKEIRASKAVAGAEEVRMVDSAFFSKRPRNADGSIWIPLDVAVAAAHLNILRIDDMRLKISKEFRDLRRDSVVKIRASMLAVPRVVLEDFLALSPTDKAVSLIGLSHRVLQSQPGADDDLIERFKFEVSQEYQRQDEARRHPEHFMGEGLLWFE